MGAAGHDRRGTECAGLHDVATAPHTAIADDLDAVPDGLDDLGEEFQRDRSGVELATTVVRHRYGGHAGVSRHSGVGHGLNALEHDRAVPHRLQPLDVAPRQARVELGGRVFSQRNGVGAVAGAAADGTRELARLGAQQPQGPTRVAHSVEEGAGPDLGRQREAPPDVAFAPAEHSRVDGEDERLVAAGRRPADQAPDVVPVVPHVHLEPESGTVAGHGSTLLDRPGAHGRERERHPGPAGGAYHGQLAVGIGDAGEADRSRDVGEGDGSSEQGRRRVGLGHTPQAPGPELQAPVGLNVAPQRDLILGPAVDVVEHPAREPLLGHAAQVGDGSRLPKATERTVAFRAAQADDRPQRPQRTHQPPRSSERFFANISLQRGQTGKRSGLRSGTQTLPQSATMGRPVTVDFTMSALRA